MDRFIGKIRISHVFFGTFLPTLQALESPITMACFLLVTFLQLLPLRNLPSFLLQSQFRHFPSDCECLRFDNFFSAAGIFSV
jgi:hypothetical protein